jgi:hypothetical protein
VSFIDNDQRLTERETDRFSRTTGQQHTIG